MRKDINNLRNGNYVLLNRILTTAEIETDKSTKIAKQ